MSKVIQSCPHCGSSNLSAYALCKLNSELPDWATALEEVHCDNCHAVLDWNDVVDTPVDPDVCKDCGGTNLQCEATVDTNTHEITELYDTKCYDCCECGSAIVSTVKQSEYLARQNEVSK